MSGMVWRFSCCKKRKERGQHLSKQKGKEIHGVTLQPRTSGIDIAQVNDFRESGGQPELPERTTKEFLSSRPNVTPEQKQKTSIKDGGDHVHDQNITLNGFEQKDFVDKVGSLMVPLSEGERDYQLIKLQLDAAQNENHKLEAQVLLANQNVRDLRHEIAVLQKRLQVAENPLPSLPPLCPPPPPPPLPPPTQPHVNPLRALLTIIQKRRNSRDPNICPLQEVGPLPGSPGDTGASYNHQCPGMNEVLEMIRNGVSLRHVIQVHKGSFRAGMDTAEPAESQLAPELQEIMKKRKVSADRYVSDGSCDGSMEEVPSSGGPSPQRDDPAPRSSSPGEGSLQSLPQQQENLTQDTRGADCEVDEGQSDGDAGSTASTLPLTGPLDQGLVRSVNASPCPDGPATDTSIGQPQMEVPGSTDQKTSSEERVLPADHGDTVDASLQSDCSASLPDQSSMFRYLNWDRWTGVDLKNALPFKSIFKSVSFMTDSNGGEKMSPQNPRDPRSASPEAPEADCSRQSLGSADSGEGAHDLQFSQLNEMLKPPLTSPGAREEQQVHAAVAGVVAHVLSPEILEESVDGPELDQPAS